MAEGRLYVNKRLVTWMYRCICIVYMIIVSAVGQQIQQGAREFIFIHGQLAEVDQSMFGPQQQYTMSTSNLLMCTHHCPPHYCHSVNFHMATKECQTNFFHSTNESLVDGSGWIHIREWECPDISKPCIRCNKRQCVQCEEGFYLDNNMCVFNCSAEPGPCDTISHCANSATGSFYCVCDAGYDTLGYDVDGVFPNCSAKDCGLPQQISNGTVTFALTTYPSVVNYSCHEGYSLVGNSSITCPITGVWEDIPSCQLKDCGIPTNDTNGSISYTSTTYGSTTGYTCDSGHDLIGNSSINCLATGHWETAPHCQIKDCGAPPNIINGSPSYTTTTYRATSAYMCVAGYDLVGNSSVECLDNGAWDTVPQCNIKDCGTPPNIINGSPSYTTTTFRATSAYTCVAGYDLIGNSSVECLDNGAWDIVPQCNIKDCGTPPNIINGSPSYTTTTFSATSAYTCVAGYDLVGNSSVECLDTGAWDTVPQCNIKDCGIPQFVTNGFRNFASTTYGSTALYSCNTGYNVFGNYSIACLANGLWATKPQCQPKDCGAPQAVSQGSFTPPSTTTYISNTTYTCNAGYDMSGNATIICQADGSWSARPICTLPPCTALVSVASSETVIANRGGTHGEWSKDALTGKVYHIAGYNNVRTIIEYPTETDFTNNTNGLSRSLPVGCDSSTNRIYNGKFYCNEVNSKNIAIIDLASLTVDARIALDNIEGNTAGNHGQCDYAWGGYTDIDIEADEKGLWVIYGRQNDACNIGISKIDLSTNTIEQSWWVPAPKSGRGNAFMKCGILYVIDNYSRNPSYIRYSYDTTTNIFSEFTSGNGIPWYNHHGYLSHAHYEMDENVIYTWDNGYQSKIALT